MIAPKYQRKNGDWWRDRLVITKRELRNGFLTIPAGTVCIVNRKYAGLSLRSESCPRCGLSVDISRVPYCDLILLDEIVVVELVKAIERAKKESSNSHPMAIVAWNGKYLVLLKNIAMVSSLRTVWTFSPPGLCEECGENSQLIETFYGRLCHECDEKLVEVEEGERMKCLTKIL